MQLDLSQSFSRGFTPGFLAGVDHQRLVHGRFPKSRGVRVGAVVAKTGRGVLIELAEEHRAAEQLAAVIKPGDGVVFDEGHPEQDEQGGRVFEVTPRRGSEALRVELTFSHGAVNFSALSPGCLVWKTDDPDFRKRMDRTYARDAKPRRAPVFFSLQGRIGGSLRLTVCDDQRQEATAEWAGPLEQARKHPLSIDTAQSSSTGWAIRRSNWAASSCRSLNRPWFPRACSTTCGDRP